MSELWRLSWALPLVFAMGIAIMLLLRRIVVPLQTKSREARRLQLCESLTVSDATCVHLVEIDRQAYLVIESERTALLQAMPMVPADLRIPAARFGPGWMRALVRPRVP
jgi:flagellar biogenesis protein FliO